MFDTIRKISVTTDRDGRFVAVATGEDAFGNRVQAEYRTDTDGCGMWEWNRSSCDWRQVLGTCQFTARTAAGLRRKIRARLRG